MFTQIKPKKQLVILLVLAIIFFFIYSFLVYDNPLSRFTWPDETANYFFISNFVSESDFRFAEPLNQIAANLIHPRSFNVFEHDLVPGSFLGLLLIYGLVAKLVGLTLIKYLTPLLAVIAGLFFYKILLKIFSPKIAFISTLLFYINPAWWYYAGFSMLPNIAFISFLIIGLFFYLDIDKHKEQRNVLRVIFAAFFIGLAFIIRTNEFLWILGILVLILLVYWRKIKWYYPLVFITVIFLVFVPIFYYNQQTYGSYLSFGYLRLEQGNDLVSQIPTEFKPAEKSALYNFTKFLVLPFGYNQENFLAVIYQYYIQLFWWLFIPAILGLLILLKKYNKQSKAVYFICFLAVSAYLIIYYGSWIFADKMTLELNQLGISYVRYFLPIYIFSLPLAALFFYSLANSLKNKKLKIILSALLIGSCIYFSVNLIYFSPNDGLIKIKENINDYNQINQKISQLTESKAVIISRRSDKIFFPQRKVISRLQLQDTQYWHQLLAQGIPLYYYSYEGKEFMTQLTSDLTGFDILMTDMVPVHGNESLYKVIYYAEDEEY